jgi:hypothetical protein
MTATQVLVRVQAKGGKFLGPDAGFSQVTLRDAATGAVLATGLAAGDAAGSGTLSGGFSAGATRQAIVTQQWGTETHLWLSATPGQATAGFTATLDLDAPTLVEFTAEGITGGAPDGHTTSQTMWLVPGDDLTAEPGVVLVMPGLRVAVAAPAGPVSAAAGVGVTANVAMMCGCRIDPTLPWLPSEFAVAASVLRADGTPVAEAPLAFQSTSTFATTAPIALPGPGEYRVVVTAVQGAEANVGSASATFSATG